MDVNSFIEDIVKANELKAYEEHRANSDITEAVLICNPRVADILKKAIYDNKLKDIVIITTPLAEKDKIYMVKNEEFIKNARMIMRNNDL